MKSPKISVVIPSYNKVKFIGQAMESIVMQKYPNTEVIIQDGGSNDGTIEIIKKYARKYPKIFKWESKKDRGQLDAINKGIGKTKGEIIIYINADDAYEHGSFSKISKAYLDNQGALWFAGKGIVIDDNGKEIAKAVTWYKNLLFKLNSKTFLLMTNYLMQPSVFITREAYKKYGPFTGTADFVTEYDLWLKIAGEAMPYLL